MVGTKLADCGSCRGAVKESWDRLVHDFFDFMPVLEVFFRMLSEFFQILGWGLG